MYPSLKFSSMLQSKIRRFIILLGFGALHMSHAGVTARWSFDTPPVDGKYLDSSGNNLHLTIDRDAIFISDGQRFGAGALELDAARRTNLFLRGTPEGGALGLENSSFSFSFWAKRQNLEVGYLFGQGRRVPRREQDNMLLHAGFREEEYPPAPNAPTLAFQGDDINVTVRDRFPLDTEKWHHYVMSYDADTKTQRIVIDGDVANDTKRSSFDHFMGETENNDFFVGNRYSDAKFFHGLLDELWVFDTALTDDEIRQLYANNMGVGENKHYVDIPEPKSYPLIIGVMCFVVQVMRRKTRLCRSI